MLVAFAFVFDAQASQPSVSEACSPGLDATCALARGGEIKDDWKAELSARQPEFEDMRMSVGPKLIEATQSRDAVPSKQS